MECLACRACQRLSTGKLTKLTVACLLPPDRMEAELCILVLLAWDPPVEALALVLVEAVVELAFVDFLEVAAVMEAEVADQTFAFAPFQWYPACSAKP